MVRYTPSRKKISALISMGFMLSYLVGMFLYPLHQFMHEPLAEEVCHEEDNACHQLLIHNNDEKGCDHEAHFTEVVSDCELCALLESVPDTELTLDENLVFASTNSGATGELTDSPFSLFPNFRYKRGPPLNS